MYIIIWTNKFKKKIKRKEKTTTTTTTTNIDGVALNYSVKAGRAWMKEEENG